MKKMTAVLFLASFMFTSAAEPSSDVSPKVDTEGVGKAVEAGAAQT